MTLNGAEEFAALTGRLIAALKLAGIEEAERRVGRKIDSEMIRELFVIERRGSELWIEPTPELDRVMAALSREEFKLRISAKCRMREDARLLLSFHGYTDEERGRLEWIASWDIDASSWLHRG